ncbi:hypothetical protein [Bacillus sp. BP-3]|nr:hypothetical protein [Bacillus sp. BP-3]MDC2866686.1 hypothetical protein [Bacillus sp. BP-3]
MKAASAVLSAGGIAVNVVDEIKAVKNNGGNLDDMLIALEELGKISTKRR